jgi:hypothetical protein
MEPLGAATFPGFRKWAGIAFGTLVVIAVLTDFPVRRRAEREYFTAVNFAG